MAGEYGDPAVQSDGADGVFEGVVIDRDTAICQEATEALGHFAMQASALPEADLVELWSRWCASQSSIGARIGMACASQTASRMPEPPKAPQTERPQNCAPDRLPVTSPVQTSARAASLLTDSVERWEPNSAYECEFDCLASCSNIGGAGTTQQQEKIRTLLVITVLSVARFPDRMRCFRLNL